MTVIKMHSRGVLSILVMKMKGLHWIKLLHILTFVKSNLTSMLRSEYGMLTCLHELYKTDMPSTTEPPYDCSEV